MTAQARISPSWAIRMLIAGVAFVGFGCWSFYDGRIKYPDQENTFQKYRQEGKLEEFRALAGKRKWKVEVHTNSQGDEYVRSPSDIATQFLMAIACLPIGFALLTRLLVTTTQRLEVDDDAFTSAKGVRIPYDAITGIDKKKWNRKGIAVVQYTVNGRAGKALIDDWIFKGGSDLLHTVEEHVPPEISGVRPEPAATEDAVVQSAEAEEQPAGEASDKTLDGTD